MQGKKECKTQLTKLLFLYSPHVISGDSGMPLPGVNVGVLATYLKPLTAGVAPPALASFPSTPILPLRSAWFCLFVVGLPATGVCLGRTLKGLALKRVFSCLITGWDSFRRADSSVVSGAPSGSNMTAFRVAYRQVISLSASLGPLSSEIEAAAMAAIWTVADGKASARSTLALCAPSSRPRERSFSRWRSRASSCSCSKAALSSEVKRPRKEFKLRLSGTAGASVPEPPSPGPSSVSLKG